MTDIIPLNDWLTLWLVAGVPLAVGWLLLIGIFVRPPTRRGFAWWVLPVVALTVVAPLVWKAGLWAWLAVQPALYALNRTTSTMLSFWWVPLATVAVAALLVGGWWLFRWERGRTEPESVEEPQEPAEPVEMWSLPDSQQWDADSSAR